MNKIVKEHYPAARLPVELREGIDPAGHVTVTVVEEEKPPERVMTLEEIFAARRPPYLTAAQVDEIIRELRGG
ncbi:MAG TPA: hypothetical protein VHK26_06715 [Methyloceanibacter sp.]|jgi:hypothetical protein|nr:hypothetical protein [Methyloceanibacter sp.]